MQSLTLHEAKAHAAKNAKIRPDTQGRLAGRLAVITGGAQGFGLGIAKELYREGAWVVLADVNLKQAESALKEFGDGAWALPVDVSDPESVCTMVSQAVQLMGGIDLFLSNAGVLKAGNIEELSPADFDWITRVNYTGYFHCVRAVSQIMKAQAEAAPLRWYDIIQINSKSGLVGSQAICAYVGGKFGGIGLTQSFAIELAPFRIKVNAICPGNYYDGPLWSDPENGLFVQYFNAGKAPGAKTVEEVKEIYLKRGLIQRGCLPEDVAKAVFYCVDQCYETGQAIPVSGGQIMLN